MLEVDDAVVRLARSDPRVQRDAFGFAFGTIAAKSADGRERRAEDDDASLVRAIDELSMAGDELVDRNLD